MFSFCVLGELLSILYSIRMLAMTKRPKFFSWRKLSKFSRSGTVLHIDGNKKLIAERH